MLHSHPRLAVAPETRFVLPAYRRRLRFGDLEEAPNRRKLAEYIVGTSFFENLGLARELVVGRIVDAAPTLGSAIEAVFRVFAERFDASRWGEKRPGYHSQIGVIMRLFPDAHIVHVVRDPRDCVASLKGMPWWKEDAYHSVSAWAESLDHADAAAVRWPVTRVQYERLVADPEAPLVRLCRAIGEDYDPAMALPQLRAAAVVPSKRWHRNARTSPSTERIGRWREDLETWELALCETALAGRMERFGYELTGARSPGARQLAWYGYVSRTRRLRLRARLASDRLKQRFEPNPVAAEPAPTQHAATGLARTFQ